MSTNPKPTLRWRFTLRESMIAVVAIAAIFALIFRSRGLSTTRFFRTFATGHYVEAAARAANVSVRTPVANGGSLSQHGRVAIRNSSISWPIPPGTSQQIFTALRDEIIQALSKSGCLVLGHGSGGIPLTEFSLEYTTGSRMAISMFTQRAMILVGYM